MTVLLPTLLLLSAPLGGPGPGGVDGGKAGGETGGVRATRQNVLILYADDLGYGDLGCYQDGSKIPTPCLDRLAAEGMLFTDAHSSSGICTPSRYALLTGRHHWRDFHGIVGPFGASVFKPNQLTLARLLSNRGYDTACVGKWHLGWDWDAIRDRSVKPRAQAAAKGCRQRRSTGRSQFPAGRWRSGSTATSATRSSTFRRTAGLKTNASSRRRVR